MKPLRVALVVKNSPSTRERENRNMGWWSYAVPEFSWEHFWLGARPVNVERELAGFDLIFHEDGGNWCHYERQNIPVVFLSFDGTLSERHYQERLGVARQSNLVLVDHDRLERFRGNGVPVRRFPYCVNERVYRPMEKTLDVSFHCGTGERKGFPGGAERNHLRRYLGEICEQAGYSYRSGVLGLPEYAESMGRSKVIVNWPRTPTNRPHRIFDAMACGAALLSRPLPPVPEDRRVAGVHYAVFDDLAELPEKLAWLLEGERWQEIARAGHELVMANHTWSIRAQELRAMLYKELGL